MVNRLQIGDLVHFRNPNCNPSTLFNWWSERYGIVDRNSVMIVAEKKGGAFHGFSLVYPRFHWQFEQFKPSHSVTKRHVSRFLGFKYERWIRAEFVPIKRGVSLESLDADRQIFDRTDRWFHEVFYDRFR